MKKTKYSLSEKKKKEHRININVKRTEAPSQLQDCRTWKKSA